jgi:hypothetical protein
MERIADKRKKPSQAKMNFFPPTHEYRGDSKPDT